MADTYTYFPTYYWPLSSSTTASVSDGLGAEIVDILLADATVQTLVGIRVYQDIDLSVGFNITDQTAIVVYEDGGTVSNTGVEIARVVIRSHAPDVDTASDITKAVKSALNTYYAGNIKDVRLSQPAKLRKREGKVGYFYYELVYSVWWSDPDISPPANSPSAPGTFELIYGDKTNPSDTLDINDQVSYRLHNDAFEYLSTFQTSPASYQGSALERQGAGSELTLHLDILGSSPTDLANLTQELLKWRNRCLPQFEQRPGQQVWLKYSWDEDDLPTPAWGQWYSYIPIYGLSAVWPKALHSGNLAGDAPFIEDVKLTLAHPGYAEGLEQELIYTYLLGTGTDLFSGSVTIAGWLTTATPASPSNANIFHYRGRSSPLDDIILFMDVDRTVTLYWTEAGGTTYDLAGAAVAEGTHHFAVVIVPSTSITIYVDGASYATTTSNVYSSMTSPGVWTGFNKNQDASLTAYKNWKIYTSALDGTQIANLYATESGAQLNPIPSVTQQAFDSAGWYAQLGTEDGRHVAQDIPGDLPAYTRYQIEHPSSGSRVIWLGCHQSYAVNDTTGPFWLELSSGKAQTTSGSGSDTELYSHALTKAAVRGRFQVLAHLKVSGAAADVSIGYAHTTNVDQYQQTAQSIASNASNLLRDLGELYIDWQSESQPPIRYFGLLVTETSASALTLDLDWTILLPWPFARLEIDQASAPSGAGTAYLSPKESYLQNDGDDNRDGIYITKGELPQLRPGVFNHLIYVVGTEGVTYSDQDLNARIFITPRWSLPGGPV